MNLNSRENQIIIFFLIYKYVNIIYLLVRRDCEDRKMHALKLNIEDNVFDKVLYLLKSLPEGGVEIISDNSDESKDKIVKNSIDFSKYSIESLSKIKDPLEWQRSIRDEWER